jgi:hypothetical protein
MWLRRAQQHTAMPGVWIADRPKLMEQGLFVRKELHDEDALDTEGYAHCAGAG